MSRIIIPMSLRAHVDGHRSIEVVGGNVDQALQSLVSKFPRIKDHLWTNGQLATHVNIFINDENIRDRDGTLTKLQPNDEIILVPAMAGG